jgi:hypothetical protein
MKSLSHTPSKNARPAISGECVVCALAPELLSPPPIVVGPFRILLSLSVFWRSIFGDAFVAPLFIHTHTHTHKYLPIWEEKMFGIAQWRNKSSRSFWHFTEETNSPLLGFFPPHSFLRVCIDWSGHLILSRLSFLFRGCKRNATSDGQRDGCRYLFDSRVFSLNQKGGAKKKRPMAKRDKDRPPLDTTTTAAATTRVLVLLSADIYAYIHVKQSPRWYAGPKAPVIWYNLWRLHRLCSSAGRASLLCGRNCFWNQRASETEETIGHCGSSNDDDDGGGDGVVMVATAQILVSEVEEDVELDTRTIDSMLQTSREP